MRSCRVRLSWLLVLAAVVLWIPATAIAGGSSAGDNQYTDPLAGQGTHKGSGGSHTQTSTTPPTTTAAASGSSTTPLSSSSPTATTASSTSSSSSTASTSASSARTLPRTGFDAGLGAAIGASLIGIGLVTRRRFSSTSR